MSKAVAGNRQFAIGKTLLGIFAYCPSPIAYCPVTTSFTVTSPITLVTNRGLAGSVLISIGEVYWEQRLGALGTAKHKGLALPRCSFREAICIQ